MVSLANSTKYLKKKSANSTQWDITTHLLEWDKSKKFQQGCEALETHTKKFGSFIKS